MIRALLRTSVVIVSIVALLAGAPRARAQEAGSTTPATGASPGLWASGPAPELWAAPAVGLGVGGLTLALAVVLGQVATANHREASNPSTTQVRADELARTIPDLSLAANVLFAVGGGMAAIGAIWVVVLPFSQHWVASEPSSRRERRSSRERPRLRVALGPSGLSLAGSF